MIKLRIHLVLIMCFFLCITNVRGEERNPCDLSINVECNPNATVDSIFTINYIVSYNGKDRKDVKFTFETVNDSHAQFLFFSNTNHLVDSKYIGPNKIQVTQTDTWTATWKALKAGIFMSPPYQVSIVNGIDVDTLDIQPICKKIRILKTDRKIVEQKNKERREAIKIGKNKDNIFAIAEIAEQEFGVGDTIHCKVYLFSKIVKPSANIKDVAIDESFSMKNCSFELTSLEEATIDVVDYNSSYNSSKYLKISFAEILIVPEKPGTIKIPPIKLYGNKEIQMYEKNKYWGITPIVIDTFKYAVYTNPLRVSIK